MPGLSDALLAIRDELPDGLLALPARRLREVLPGPTLLRLAGQKSPPLFVSVLLHGNEDTGWEAVRAILQKYTQLPRSLYLFIGNVAAAAQGVRCLPHQQDYNRIWQGAAAEVGAEQSMAQQLLKALADTELFAAVDIHNNTGSNPHYACINRLQPGFLHLATLFSRTVVFFLKPDTVLSLAMARFCPSVTVECGKPGEAHGVAHAIEFLEACLHLSEFPQHDLPPQDLDLFHTVATVKVPAPVSVGLHGSGADLELVPDLDRFNFSELPAGTRLAQLNREGYQLLEVRDEQGVEVSGRYFSMRDGALYTRLPVMPSMLTLNVDIIKQDCLCYLMERLPLPD